MADLRDAAVVLDGGALTLVAVAAVARSHVPVELSASALTAVERARAFVERLGAGDAPIYGITTGVGKLKDTLIPPAERAHLQRNLVRSHAGGVGPALAEPEVRAMMLLLAASLARGASGVRPRLIEV